MCVIWSVTKVCANDEPHGYRRDQISENAAVRKSILTQIPPYELHFDIFLTLNRLAGDLARCIRIPCPEEFHQQ